MKYVCLLIALIACSPKAAKLAFRGDAHELRVRQPGERASSGDRAPILILAVDGVPRGLLYRMIRQHELPNVSALLGDAAYFDDSMMSALPSTTMPAWVTMMTGVPPAEHGVTGNEYFIRETQQFACPAPVSFNSMKPTLAIYTDRYLDKLVEVPTVYEKMRAQDRDVLIWISMNHLFRGADKLLLAKRKAIAKALAGVADYPLDKTAARRKLYATLDESSIDAVVDHLKTGPLPDVLTIYVSGTDLYAHVAHEGPNAAQRWYLRSVVDPALGKLTARLRERGMLDKLWIVMTADHGHTAVPHDKSHALGTSGAPHDLLKTAGFRVRPPQQDVSSSDPFNAVIAYGGATAYVYLADRSLCPGAKEVCQWKLPPRYREDVLAAAEAFHRNNLDGSLAPVMKGSLDLILTRKPQPFGEVDLPFEVYLGEGKTVPLDEYLRERPRPSYVEFDRRMRALAVGRHGERAGDIFLLARDGDEPRRERRFYFANQYRSWHGSPSRADSEIPLIVANRRHSSDELAAFVRQIVGNEPFQWKIADLLLAMRGQTN